MDMCQFQPIAIRVHRRTIGLIEALDDRVSLEHHEGLYFMVYCADSDHEETDVITEETFERTYGKMPGHVLACYVHTID